MLICILVSPIQGIWYIFTHLNLLSSEVFIVIIVHIVVFSLGYCVVSAMRTSSLAQCGSFQPGIKSCRRIPTFWRNMLPPSSGSNPVQWGCHRLYRKIFTDIHRRRRGDRVLCSSIWMLTTFFAEQETSVKAGGDMFLQNVGWHSMDYMALYPRR
jgi:hypothetical protein